MEEQSTLPLLQKEYHLDCPGCDYDRKRDLQEGLPYKEFLYIWMICLTAALPVSLLFPFLYFMTRDLHVAERTEDIGFYAGFVGASFMLGRCLISTVWGIAADRIGRKPIVMFGIFSVVVFNTLFGLSTSYWMAIATRFLLGALNGLLGPIKATKVCRTEHQALGLSLVSTAWGIGLIIGPALGGYLALPAEKFPNVFSPDSFFGRFPYLLPCLCSSLFAVVVLVSCIWMPETLHMHNVCENENKNFEALEAHLNGYEERFEQTSSFDDRKSLFKNWPLMSSIIMYCVFSFHDMAYTEVFSLWAESDKKYGGLSLSSEDVGQVLSVTAILCIPILFAYPYMTYLSGIGLSIILNIASVLKNNLGHQDQRGAANGLSMTVMSLFKSVAPAGAGIVFSWAQKRHHAFFFPEGTEPAVAQAKKDRRRYGRRRGKGSGAIAGEEDRGVLRWLPRLRHGPQEGGEPGDPVRPILPYLGHQPCHLYATIVIISILIFHDKGFAHCKKSRRYWILCWIRRCCIYVG
ncbi:protein ZINC INDUCED FACILITATOR-LIKE 1-like isoform X3 [Panicum virgatum]|uniref:protein ZINC INDUCED FACILITATOR-LIKE 1-like isoform X3 n=1 Tax=Panicum virgatum TaxID=38727 RepID=UPI0019D65BCE|nr:protein ZINC INDUCED FACILITATOR-LIKE 1-like isoform X3 [Panicum virgatum]